MTRAEAARLNGAKSKGPTTTEGKARSAQNARKHGIVAESMFVLENENPEIFRAILAELTDTFRPETQIEMDLVCQMANARWRMRRVWAVETECMEAKMDRHARLSSDRQNSTPEQRQAAAFQSLADNSKVLSLIPRYEASLNRTYRRALQDLEQLRTARKAVEPTPQELETPAATQYTPNPVSPLTKVVAIRPAENLQNEPNTPSVPLSTLNIPVSSDTLTKEFNFR